MLLVGGRLRKPLDVGAEPDLQFRAHIRNRQVWRDFLRIILTLPLFISYLPFPAAAYEYVEQQLGDISAWSCAARQQHVFLRRPNETHARETSHTSHNMYTSYRSTLYIEALYSRWSASSSILVPTTEDIETVPTTSIELPVQQGPR